MKRRRGLPHAAMKGQMSAADGQAVGGGAQALIVVCWCWCVVGVPVPLVIPLIDILHCAGDLSRHVFRRSIDGVR